MMMMMMMMNKTTVFRYFDAVAADKKTTMTIG